MRIGRFLKILGLLFLAWGIVSWFVPFDEGDDFYTDAGYNTFYILIGLLVTWIGATWNPELRRIWTLFAGILFLAIAAAGWIVVNQDAPNLGFTNLENPADNLVHLAVGLAFVLAAKFAKPDAVYSEPPGTTMNVR
ncbi:MAG: hypothetical protein V3S98_01730 [Dehalococcoidia bacterium]